MSEPENLLEVYLALYPEARGRATVDDIQNVTIANVFYNAPYNDLSFLVEGHRIVMVEAQSTWSENIVLRIALCALHVLDRYIAAHRSEVKDIMMTIFSQEYATEVFRKTTQEEVWSEAWSGWSSITELHKCKQGPALCDRFVCPKKPQKPFTELLGPCRNPYGGGV